MSGRVQITTKIPDELVGALPHLEQYSGVWAIHEPSIRSQLSRIHELDLSAHVQAIAMLRPVSQVSPSYETRDGVAILDIVGTITKRGSMFSPYVGNERMRETLQAAMADPDVGAIMFRVDSPGGSVSGVGDLADAIYAASEQLPTAAHIEDIGASAAYELASQTQRLSSGPDAMVGSIGTYAVLYDVSAMAAQEGIRVHVIRAGQFKGAGEPGAEISEAQLEDFGRVIDEFNDQFLSRVERGRPLSNEQVADLADGRVHVGANAEALGLVDSIETFDEAVANLAARISTSERGRLAAKAKEPTMAEETTTTQPAEEKPQGPKAASYNQLVAACEGADPEFLCAQLADNATLEQAQRAWLKELKQRADAAKEEAEKAKAEATLPGNPPVTSTGKSETTYENAASEWNRRVREKMATGMSEQRARSLVNREDPELREQMIEEVNTQARRPAVSTR